MGNCLITKLKGSVSDISLPKVGYLIVKIVDNESKDAFKQGICLAFNKNEEVEVKNGFITDSNLTENKGTIYKYSKDATFQFYFSNGDVYISIPKYNLKLLRLYCNVNGNMGTGDRFNFNLSELKYSDGLEEISVPNAKYVSGELSDISNIISLKELDFRESSIVGNLNELHKLSNLMSLNISKSNITGDLSAISELRNLKSFSAIGNGFISGNLSALSSIDTLTSIHLEQTNVSGDISALSSLSNLNLLFIDNSTYISGDLSKLPDNLVYLSANQTFSWKGTKTGKICTIYNNPKLGDDVDNMLINQAALEASDGAKFLYVTGNRTSASDDAVATLQSKGYTVSITPA